jgi:molybdate transport system substrate-binding protein
MKKINLLLSLMLLLILAISCSREKPESPSTVNEISQKELLIYCGITMIKPISEIAAIIEKRENCKISITKGGSGNLLKSLIYNKIGDLYLPGSDKYYDLIEKEHAGLITRKQLVGHNKAVIMVQKGNPSKIDANLDNLTNNKFGVMIGNPESGSIGKETKQILEKKGNYHAVIQNVMSLTTDSKNLVKVIKQKKADIVINWFATSTWDNNSEYIDVIQIDPEFSKVNNLVLGLLKYSQQTEIANRIIDFAISEEGVKIFRKHGLYFD